jgi:hemin uptake protein HemP
MTLPAPPHETSEPAATAARPLDAPSGRPPAIDSATLFGGAHEIIIRHGDREYRLRRTRLDKLILTA